ncbi:MAG: nitroreductase family protein [Anaerolineaceae bacterium]|nr:nitroreductase family protein [Anaerolineaceae bacterium]
MVRYIRYSSSVYYSPHDLKRLEAALFFYYHKIEKALSLPIVKPLFGLGYIENTLKLVEQWVQLTGDYDAVVFRGAYSALVSYKSHVGQSLQKSNPKIYERLEQLIFEYERPDIDLNLGGTLEIHNENLTTNNRIQKFEELIRQRHSVRVFTEKHIPDEEIYNAVKLAQHTPSVCNRQCWHVHVFTSDKDKTKILQHQNGNRGFGHLADRVLLITADLKCFFTSGERQQPSIDAGMFAMSLILSFEAMGIASCCLNLNLNAGKESAFRKTALLSKWEKPIMLIVIGYPPKSLKVAVSARKSIESLLSFRDLNN